VVAFGVEQSALVILGLGSNLGNRAIHLKRAIACLCRGSEAVVQAVKLSRIYESPALTPAGSPPSWDLPYLNCALASETDIEPEALLRHAQQVEKSLGRQDHERWAPRVIDIDILWWDGPEVRTEDLAIPHPGILQRPFVLEPLRDLIPDVIIDGETIEVHAARLKTHTSAAEQPLVVHSPEADFAVRCPTLMGILNVTPNSFSDGGRFMEPELAIEHVRRLVEDGAGIIDVGGESTRPDGTSVDPATEWSRIEPVLEGLRGLQEERRSTGGADAFRISLDSRNPSTVRSALEVGVDVLNDVTGFRNPGMMEIARSTDIPLVFMHSLSIPVSRGESIPDDLEPVEFLIGWARERMAAFDESGIDRHRLIFDPGIGFGKSTRQNWHILEHAGRLHDLGIPVLIGHSRKSFLEAVTDKPSADRDADTLTVSRGLAVEGIEILRVHDVRGHTALFRRHMPDVGRGRSIEPEDDG